MRGSYNASVLPSFLPFMEKEARFMHNAYQNATTMPLSFAYMVDNAPVGISSISNHDGHFYSLRFFNFSARSLQLQNPMNNRENEDTLTDKRCVIISTNFRKERSIPKDGATSLIVPLPSSPITGQSFTIEAIWPTVFINRPFK